MIVWWLSVSSFEKCRITDPWSIENAHIAFRKPNSDSNDRDINLNMEKASARKAGRGSNFATYSHLENRKSVAVPQRSRINRYFKLFHSFFLARKPINKKCVLHTLWTGLLPHARKELHFSHLCLPSADSAPYFSCSKMSDANRCQNLTAIPRFPQAKGGINGVFN